MCVYIYVYIHIHTRTNRNQELDMERCTVKLTRVLSKAPLPASCAVYANAQRFSGGTTIML